MLEVFPAINIWFLKIRRLRIKFLNRRELKDWIPKHEEIKSGCRSTQTIPVTLVPVLPFPGSRTTSISPHTTEHVFDHKIPSPVPQAANPPELY